MSSVTYSTHTTPRHLLTYCRLQVYRSYSGKDLNLQVNHIRQKNGGLILQTCYATRVLLSHKPYAKKLCICLPESSKFWKQISGISSSCFDG